MKRRIGPDTPPWQLTDKESLARDEAEVKTYKVRREDGSHGRLPSVVPALTEYQRLVADSIHVPGLGFVKHGEMTAEAWLKVAKFGHGQLDPVAARIVNQLDYFRAFHAYKVETSPGMEPSDRAALDTFLERAEGNRP
jgi:hypothetical protein